MQNVDMVGCRRRRIYDLQTILGRPVDFQCRGQEGPPCTVRIGDTVNFNATFTTGKGFDWLDVFNNLNICWYHGRIKIKFIQSLRFYRFPAPRAKANCCLVKWLGNHTLGWTWYGWLQISWGILQETQWDHSELQLPCENLIILSSGKLWLQFHK